MSEKKTSAKQKNEKKPKSTPTPEANGADERQILYDFWESLPAVAVREIPSKVFTSHPVRPAILKVMREGILDQDATDRNVQKRRYALKPKEIRKLLGEREDIEMSQTNLYFHLNILEKEGLIQVVSRILEGRHKVAYYGRVARTIIHRDPEESLETYKRRFEEMRRLMKVKRPDFEIEQLDILSEELLEMKLRRDQALGEWMARNEALMNAEGIDSLIIFKFLKVIDSTHPDYVRFFRKIADLFEFDLDADSSTGNSWSPRSQY